MGLTEFVLKVIDDTQSELQLSLAGVELEQLMWRPAPHSNSMAWLAWHIARLQDARASALSRNEQLWISESWYARFGLPPDPANHGRGHSDADVDSVRPESAASLSEYASAAHASLRHQIVKLPDAQSTAAVTGYSGDESVAELVFRAVHVGLAHVGQLMYVRGLVEERHWFPR